MPACSSSIALSAKSQQIWSFGTFVDHIPHLYSSEAKAVPCALGLQFDGWRAVSPAAFGRAGRAALCRRHGNTGGRLRLPRQKRDVAPTPDS